MTALAHHIELPTPPDDQEHILAAGGVACWQQDVEIWTYEPGQPDPFPMFFDRRVYQGSDGKVYPLPFIDRVATHPTPRRWRGIHLENPWVRLMLLPDIGGRIHVAYDKTRDYDFFYRNNVIKPALVGLAGPWISGGVEFNWPQHHRPGTYLPVETHVERGEDGSVTVWHSDLDPLQRMRGTHGVRLRPDDATVEVAVRLFNRTDEPQSFLWWANVAAAVHEDYQSFFPVDVRYVADHARRAVTAFPDADRPYYGVDYPELARQRTGAAAIDRYVNIPVPTSYMITDTWDSFFGGYDHRAGAGFVHWADRTIAPGKKQWTWGDGPIGRAWDRQLTDGDGPYVELMAGVFTDNQPDFSYLAPGETREFSQYWYPIQDIGVVHQATRDAALAVNVDAARVRIGVAAPHALRGRLTVAHDGKTVLVSQIDVAPGQPVQVELEAPGCAGRDDLEVRLHADGRELVGWRRHEQPTGEPWLATEPPDPDAVDSVDEALLTAQHLLQYRHPTRSPHPYLQRALQLDPGDSRAHLGLAALAHASGRYAAALSHLDTAAARICRRNLNPRTGELPYLRGLVLERLGRSAEAAEAFAKSTWDGGYATAGHLGAARVLLRAGAVERGLEHAEHAVASDRRNPTAQGVRALALRRLGRAEEADHVLAAARAADPLDPFLAALDGTLDVVDPRTYLTIAQDLARSGEDGAALVWAGRAAESGPTPFGNPGPVARYLRAALLERAGEDGTEERKIAAVTDRTLAFPAGLDDHDVLSTAVARAEADGNPDPVALGLLGTWLMGARRVPDAVPVFQAAIDCGCNDPVVLRNTAIAVVNTAGDLDRADTLLARAIELAGPRPRLVYERDQLARLRDQPSAIRLAWLESTGADLLDRDDLAIAHVELLLDAGQVDGAMSILTTRVFQPFEGGEGKVIAAWDQACVAAAAALVDHDPAAAAKLLDDGLTPPENLGEGRHPAGPLAARLVAAGDAHQRAGDEATARARWQQARTAGGSLAVAPRPARDDDYWIGVAHCRLAEWPQADAVWNALEGAADERQAAPRAPDYFATSLPELLLFAVDDVAGRRRTVTALRSAVARGRQLAVNPGGTA